MIKFGLLLINKIILILMKKKLLWMGDDPRSKSGYGRVLNEMLPYLSKSFEVIILAIGYKGNTDQTQIIDSSDGTPFGFKSIVENYNQIKPDIFILINDHKIIWGWLSALKENCDLSFCKIIPYVCTEYIGISRKDMIIYNETCHHILVMANFTGEEMKKRGCNIDYTRLSHGYPQTLTNIDTQIAKNKLNISPNAFVFYSGNRNQPRKRLDIIIRAYVEFLKKYQYQDVLLMMNCGLTDMGINIPELYEQLCLDNQIENYMSKIYYCNKTHNSSEFNDEELSLFYSCANVGITTSTGESFGLIPFEMCLFNVPQIIPNFGGIIETIKEGCIAVQPNDYYTYPNVIQSANGTGAIIHYKEVAQAMEMYYTNKEIYKKHSKSIKNNLNNCSWEDVSNQCIHFLNNQLYSKYKIPSKELIDEYENILKKHDYIFKKMDCFLKINNEFLEGGCMYEHGNYTCIEDKTFLNKQLNLYELSKNCEHIIEIGFNLGNSALLYLLSNSKSKIVCFDICTHKYVKLCFDYLNELFPNRMILIEGDSTKTIPMFYEDKYNNYFDLIHIDGGHQQEIAHQDFMNTLPMAKNIIIFDDDWLEHLNDLIKSYIKQNLVSEYFYFKSIKYTHKLLIKNNNITNLEFFEKYKINNTLSNNNKIPKIIHQIWIGPIKPPYSLLNTWKNNHHDWEYILWDEEKLKNEHFINQKLIDHTDIITIKSDLIRYELLYKYGGIYIDADIICKKKISDDFLCHDLFASYYDQKHSYITNSTIGSIQNNNILKELILYFNELKHITIKDPVEFSGGPFDNLLKKKNNIKIYDYYYFNPIDFLNINNNENVDDSNIYGVHFWGTTRSNMTNKKVNIYEENIVELNKNIIQKNNIYMCTHSKDDLISGELINNGIWEEKITEKYIRLLNKLDKNDLILDVGANLGYYSIIAASHGYEVYAFEPFEKNYDKFYSSILLNSYHKNIKLFKNIVSNKSHEKKSLNIVPGPIVNYGCITVDDKEGNIETIAIDDLNIKKNIDILKIDVEGYEYEVIEGLKNLILNNQVKNIIIECSPKFRNIEYYFKIIKFLILNSYYIYDFNNNQFTFEEFKNDLIKFDQGDYYFKKSDFIPIQSINLKNNIDRKNHIIHQIQNYNFKYHLVFYEAIDGKLVDYNKSSLISDFAKSTIEKNNKEHGHNMTKGGLGLIHSKFDIWTNIFKPCLIIEDDILFEKDFETKLNNYYQELPQDWDIFYLGYYHEPITKKFNNNIFYAEKIYGLFGYIINPKSISKITKNVFPCDYQIDTEIHRKNNYLLNNFVLKNKIINHSGFFNSNIQIYDVDKVTIEKYNNLTKKNKILITGFPHCGTTITRNILGHIENIHEIIEETPFINENMLYKNKITLIKHPWIKINYYSPTTILEDNNYNDFHIVFIIRNPYCVFNSLNSRFKHKNLELGYSIKSYLETLEYFDYYINNPKENIYCIKYENLFENNYSEFKELINNFNVQYDESIFNNEKYKNKLIGNLNTIYDEEELTLLRNKQINTLFENKNDFSNLNLTLDQIEQLKNHPLVQKYYPLNDEINNYISSLFKKGTIHNKIQKINNSVYQVQF